MSRSPRIFHLIHSGAVGGGPQVVLDLATTVPGTHTIVAPDDGPLLHDASGRGVLVIELARSGKYSFALSVPRLTRCFQEADVVHLHGQFAGFYGSLSASLARVPSIYTAHFPSFVTDWSLRNKIRNYLAESITCSRSSLTVACCHTMQQEYLRRRLVAPGRLRTVYNGVRERQRHAAKGEVLEGLGIDRNAPLVLAVGRFTPQKGFDLLIEAVPDVLRSVPTARFLLAGDGEMRGELSQKASTLGVAHAVDFLGFRRDGAELMQVADVVAVPSRYDVFPLVPLEAMMASRVVVASDLPVLREAVVNGDTGLLVPPTKQGVADGLVEALAHDEQREAMGRRAQARARAHFSVETMAGEYERLYAELAGWAA